MSIKAIARHRAAVEFGAVDKTNVIGIRKAINAMEIASVRRETVPVAEIDAIFELEQAIVERHPTVTGELHETGLGVLRNPRYAKRWTDAQRATIDGACRFDLIRFDRIGHSRWQAVPVYHVIARDGSSFAFRNIAWQSAWALGEQDGPRVQPEWDR